MFLFYSSQNVSSALPKTITESHEFKMNYDLHECHMLHKALKELNLDRTRNNT